MLYKTYIINTYSILLKAQTSGKTSKQLQNNFYYKLGKKKNNKKKYILNVAHGKRIVEIPPAHFISNRKRTIMSFGYIKIVQQ